jgi:hypothetical protein
MAHDDNTLHTYLYPLEVQNPHILKVCRPRTLCCQEYFRSASDAILETWGPCGWEHQDLAIQNTQRMC